MDASDSRAVLQTRWFHPLIGVVGLLALAAVAFVDRDSLIVTISEVALPVAILVAFLAASRLYVTRREALLPPDVARINRWTLLGVVFVGFVEVAFRLLPFFSGSIDAVYALLGLSAVGALAGTVVGVTNVRERRRTRQAQELEHAIETSSEGIAVADPDGRYTFVNSAYAEMHGHTREAVTRMSWQDLTPESVLEESRPEVRAALESTGSWEGRLDGVRKDGTVFPREISVSVTPEEGHIVIARDVTGQQRQENRLRTLQEAVLELQEADSEQAVTDVTVSIAQDLIGEPLTGFFRYDPEADILVPAAFSEEGLSFVESADIGDQIGALGPGTLLYERFHGEEVSIVEDYPDVRSADDPAVPLDTFIFAPVADVGVLLVGAPEHIELPEANRYVARILAQNAANAFARVEYEEELEVQNTRLEFLNSLLRHDVLNGMTIIRAHGAELADTVEASRRTHAHTIVKWADNVTALVTRVRALLNALTVEEASATHRVDIVPGIRDEVDRLEGAYPATDFTVDVPDELVVIADDIVHDVVGNVVRNAAEHNRQPDAWVRVSAERRDGVARVVVEDNGPGVPADATERIFRRGETGHAKESGSGFGLFFVDTMVNHWDGDVWVEDCEAGGARFVVELPAA